MTPSPWPFKGVLLDMDGCLCDSEPFICQAGVMMFARRHGVTVSHQDFVPFFGTGGDRFFQGVADKHGVAIDLVADQEMAYDLYLELIRGSLAPLPGLLEVLARWRAAGARLAVATSAVRRKMTGNLDEMGIAGWFDAMVCGHDITRNKPDPQIFQVAASRLGLEPAQCLAVEDAPSGVRAAKAAGCRCLALTTSVPAEMLWQAGADWVSEQGWPGLPPELMPG